MKTDGWCGHCREEKEFTMKEGKLRCDQGHEYWMLLEDMVAHHIHCSWLWNLDHCSCGAVETLQSAQ